MLYLNVLEQVGAIAAEPAFLDIKNTPKRVARMLVDELLVGYRRTEADLIDVLRLFKAEGQRELVVQQNVPFTSVCAHHLLPFHGHAHIGYLPGKYLLGLSKLSRILDHYSARLQIQERLGAQVADFLMTHVGAGAAFVVLKAEHQCMSCRGVKKPDVQTVTASIRPVPGDPSILAEFYRMAKM